jgi:hypothetical protein
MTMQRPMARLAVALGAFLLSACGPTSTTPPPTNDPASAGIVIGCASIENAECQFVVKQIVAGLPAARGRPFAIEITLFGCDDPAACPRTLAVRTGMAVVEYADGGQPIQLSLTGPPQQPLISIEANSAWSGLIQPSSERVGRLGPVPFEVGHCGLSHMVDFDGSFWVPVGQIDGDASGFINSESGKIRLIGPNLADYAGTDGFSAKLARFPGAKRFWLCA